MRQIVKVNFLDGSSCYIQGFDYTGNPTTGTIETAQRYPEWLAPVTACNARNALKGAGMKVSEVICVDVD